MKAEAVAADTDHTAKKIDVTGAPAAAT